MQYTNFKSTTHLFSKIFVPVCLMIQLVIPYQITAQAFGQNGMVVSSGVLASQAGVDILKKGGNAIDASITTAFVLAVTHPQAGNIGGGGFIVFMKASGDVTTIDFREKAPLAATANMFLNSAGQLVENSNHDSIKAIGVPGTVAGL